MADDLDLFEFAGNSSQQIKPSQLGAIPLRPAVPKSVAQKENIAGSKVPKTQRQQEKRQPVKSHLQESESTSEEKESKTRHKADKKFEKAKQKQFKSRNKAKAKADKESLGSKKTRKPKEKQAKESSESEESVGDAVEFVKRQPMAPPDSISLSPTLNKETKRLFRLARVHAREQQFQLDFDRQMNQQWSRYDDLFPLNSRLMQFFVTLICLAATTLHIIVWIMRLLGTDGSQQRLALYLGLVLFDIVLLGTQLKIAPFLRLCFDEGTALLNRAFVAWYLVVTLQFYPFAFTGTLLNETIVAFVAMGLAGCVSLIWVVQWVSVLTCTRV